jgi:Uma2 family endonuclease
MRRATQRHYTLDDYFSVEEMSEVKHEYYDGEIFALAGASLDHNQITGNLFAFLKNALRGTSCRAFASDLRICTPSGLYTYPDVAVICGEIKLSGDRLETVTNPVLLAEVLSDSTRDYDRGDKFTLYRTIPTLREYLLIEQDEVFVEHFSLEGDEWRKREYRQAEDLLWLPAIKVTIPVAEVYDGVEFKRR